MAAHHSFSLLALSVACSLTCYCLLRSNEASSPSRCLQPPQHLGIFVGSNSPFGLAPVESLGVEGAGAWPAANPVPTYGDFGKSLSDLAVTSPFLFPAENRLHAFYEESGCGGSLGRIAVASSIDAGLTWQAVGVVLEEDWHLSTPFVFQHGREVFMVPDSPTVQKVNLYRTTRFPSAWEYVLTLVEAPLHSVSIMLHNGTGEWFMFGSRPGHSREDIVEVYTARAPHGPWEPHSTNPVSAEMLGRVLQQNGKLLRFGLPCKGGRCAGITAFDVALTKTSYEQHMVPLPVLQRSRQPAAWDSAGYSHLDIVQLPNGNWLAAATSSSQPAPLPPAAFTLRLLSQLLPMLSVAALVALVAVRLGAAQRLLGSGAWGRRAFAPFRPSMPVLHTCSEPVPDAPMVFISIASQGAPHQGGAKALAAKQPAIRQFAKPTMRPSGGRALSWRGVAVAAGMAALLCSAVVARCTFHALEPFWQPTVQVAVDGRYSKFTLMVMSYEARIDSLKYYIQHYSHCPSVGEILVVWNKGTPPDPEKDLAGPVPVRVRVEAQNSMNNRYRPDPDIKYRAVLSLDDDIMMTCSDVERGFALWRTQPEMIVGYYPRLITQGQGGRLEYNWEDATVKQGEYNAILTGAAFLDARTAFPLYWADGVAPGRQLVDELVNCDDLLMNFVVANASRGTREQQRRSSGAGAVAAAAQATALEQEAPVVQFVRAQRRFDISYLSGVGLSHNYTRFQVQAEQCLEQFVRLFDGNPLQTQEFDWTRYKAPHCGTEHLIGCLYL